MKKSLLFLLTVLFCVGFANAKSYTITFKAENEANYALTAEEISALVATGSSYIGSFSFNGTICEGKNGIRISKGASLTINLSSEGQVAATSVVVNARKKTSMMSSADATLSLNGSAPQTLNDANNDQVLTFDLDGSKLADLVFDAAGNGVYISSITINYATTYSIAFKAENEANYGLTAEEIAALVSEGAAYISSFSFDGTICEGKNGIRISKGASLTINLSSEGQVAATSVEVKARKKTSMMSSADATLTLNGSAPQTLNDANNDQVLTFDLDGSKLTNLVFNAAGNGVYISSITVKEGAVIKKDVELSFDKETVLAINGGEFTAPVLTCSVEGLEIEYTSSNTTVATVDNTGKVTLVGAGETIISARFAGNSQYRAAQASYTLTVASVINSWSEFTALNSVQPFKALTAKINFPCTVTYQTTVNSARHTYVVANGVAMLIYGDVPDYEAGDVIPAGWIATYKQPVSSKYYCAVVEEAPEASTEKATFTTTETKNVSTISTYYGIYVVNNVDFLYGPQANQYGNIIGKYLEVSGRNKVEKEITFRDYFGIPGSDVAGKYNVTFIAENNGAGGTILCPVKYELVESTGIDSILEEEIPAEYYNLDGVRVENPTNGLYIRRQGDKVTKVIIR